jgi:mycoredoxin
VQRWLWLVVLVSGVWAGVTYLQDDVMWAGGLMIAASLALAWWVSPWRGGRSARHREVMARPRHERPVIIYWRPGCSYCARLRRRLGARRTEAVWVNIWQDAEAAAYVREHNAGNETVPTVVLEGEVVTNPDPAVVAARLGG